MKINNTVSVLQKARVYFAECPEHIHKLKYDVYHKAVESIDLVTDPENSLKTFSVYIKPAIEFVYHRRFSIIYLSYYIFNSVNAHVFVYNAPHSLVIIFRLSWSIMFP